MSSGDTMDIDRGVPIAAETATLELGLPGRLSVIAIDITGLLVATMSWIGLVLFIPFAIVGTLLAFRRPQTSIGWILVGLGWLFAIQNGQLDPTAEQFADMTLSWPLRLFAVIQGASGAAVLVFALLAIVFPSGRLPQGRWGIVVRSAFFVGLLLVLLTVIGPLINVNLVGSPSVIVRNPAAILPDLPFWEIITGSTAFFAFGVLLIGAVISLAVRYRRAYGIERQQLRWFSAALVFVIVAMMIGFGISGLVPGSADTGLAWILAIVAFTCVPIAIGIAVLRYRLYEIDTIINRTVLYGGVTVVLLVAFGLANIGLQRMLESLTGQRSELLTGALGIGVAVAYGPMRRLVRPLVDRLLPGRAVLTLLFTDIVGSTEHIVELGDQRWRMLLGRYRAAVRQELTRAKGHEVDTAGDAFFATFDRPSLGVNCAWAVRSAVKELGLETRTGVHMGECEMRGEKVSGIEVHTAARIMAAAAEGEILLSAAVRDAISGTEFPTTDRGRHELKGVPGEWQLYGLNSRARVRARRTAGGLAPMNESS
jgi:class 3 adenylate cyclase